MRNPFLLALLAAASCSETRTIDLSFGAGDRTPLGFRCQDASGTFLALRALEPGRVVRFSLVVEFVGLDGVPSCRAGDIVDFCLEHGCEVLPGGRVCTPVPERQLGLGENVVAVIGEMLRGLDGILVTADAPHGPVIVRAIATTQDCSALAGITALDPLQLVGCALSCPVQLESVEGEVSLDLPTLSEQCADAVLFCATFSR
jgi:hypothetical protein